MAFLLYVPECVMHNGKPRLQVAFVQKKIFFLVLSMGGEVPCFTFLFVISGSLIVNMGNIFESAHVKECVLLFHPVIQIYFEPILLRYNQYPSG